MGIFILACYTVLIVMSNIEAKAQSNLLPPGFKISTLTPEEISHREYGSKIVIVVEQMQIAVIWSCKACLLILYHRLTESVAAKSNIAIRLLAVYVALGFVVMEILYFSTWCRPFHEYWSVPTKSSQCNALINHRITNAVFNISSDLIMLCIALPLFLRSLLPLKRKLILCGIFSLGVFVILAAVLNKYYSFTKPYEPTWIFWYCRESSTAILVANLPFTWTLLRKLFNLGAFDEAHPPPPTYHSSRTAGGRRTARAHHIHNSANSNEKHSESHAASSNSKGSRSMSLIGSICAPKGDEPTTHVSENSQHSGNGLLHEAIQSHDFAVDLERGLSGTDSETSPISLQTALRSTSPTFTRPRPARLSADGTGGFLRAPRPAHLVPSRPHSRASSAASAIRRPISPTPTHRSLASTNATTRPMSPAPSHEDTHIKSHTHGGAGGGRSAADRKKRARMSH